MDADAIERAEGDWYELRESDHRVVATTVEREWRFEQFVLLGFPAWQAEAMAGNADVDLRWLESLVKGGCPIETAWQIAGVDAVEPSLELHLLNDD